MKKYIEAALLANAATLGVHWIYDFKYLESLSKEQSILFLRQEKERFEKANLAFYAYPNSQVGGVTVQGQIIKWLYNEMKSRTNFSFDDYSKLLYEKFKVGGSYVGYVESYSKKHVFAVMAKNMKLQTEELPVMDDQLVGFIPYLVCKELGLGNKKAFELTNVYSLDEDYLTYFNMFDRLFDLIGKMPFSDAVNNALSLGPKKYQEALKMAIEMDNTNEFITQYSGRACSISQAIPLIIHIVAHTNSYQEAVERNAVLGGASADRAILLGAICAQDRQIPSSWKEIGQDKN